MDFINKLKEKHLLIGALHFPPLPGFEGFTSMEDVLKFSITNAETLEEAGFDSIIVENNYDLPHLITVQKETVEAMKYITANIMKRVSIPIGVSVLWNSYKEAFDIAQEVGGKYIRVPVFVDNVETSYGSIYGNPEDVIKAKKEIGKNKVLVFTDIQVKHSKLLNVRPIEESAKEAIMKGSDALIITGKWTGDSPKMDDLKDVRNSVGEDFPIIVGSGATKDNMNDLMRYASGIIVGTAIKGYKELSKEISVNLVEPYIPIDSIKAREFVDSFNGLCLPKK